MTEYLCPLGKKVVDFADEPEFSSISMFILGREWLDEKDKVIEIAGKYMPETFCYYQGEWAGERRPPTDETTNSMVAPWFVKEADKNLGGEGIGVCRQPSEIVELLKPSGTYVVQQHVRRPLLTDDGRKAHLKFYCLLSTEADGVSWTLYTYKKPLLCISPNKWSPDDLSQDTQITIHRHPVPPWEVEGWKQHWSNVYAKCRASTVEVVKRAVEGGKLKGRHGKKQFEVFSADWMPDQEGGVWLFEFNMSPAVCQKKYDDANRRDDKRDKLRSHDKTMLRDALSVIIPWESDGKMSGCGLWDEAAKFQT